MNISLLGWSATSASGPLETFLDVRDPFAIGGIADAWFSLMLPNREGGTVRSTKRHASRYGLHRLEIRAAIAAVVAGIDERHRAFDQLHDRNVARRADLQRAKLRDAI